MSRENLFSVAAIRKSRDGRINEYLLNESPRVFEIGLKIARDETAIAKINEAFNKKLPIKLKTDPSSNFINKITKPSEAEAKEFLKLRIKLENPEKPKTINLNDLK